jgi:23S rRNA (adenine2503-C2)-methyltransferase
MERVERFQSILEAKGVRAYVRRPRGRDIYAACGQLAARRPANNLNPQTLHQLIG